MGAGDSGEDMCRGPRSVDLEYPYAGDVAMGAFNGIWELEVCDVVEVDAAMLLESVSDVRVPSPEWEVIGSETSSE